MESMHIRLMYGIQWASIYLAKGLCHVGMQFVLLNLNSNFKSRSLSENSVSVFIEDNFAIRLAMETLSIMSTPKTFIDVFQ